MLQALDEPWRKVSVTNDGNENKCDKLMSPGWKRFADSIGESCPKSLYRCGLDWPGWLNGAHPTVVGQNTTMEVCFKSKYGCCASHRGIHAIVEVINC